MNDSRNRPSPPWERRPTGGMQTLRYWIGWLKNPNISPRKRVVDSIQSGHIPAHILMHFACDCFEQALCLLQSLHAQPDKIYEDLLEEKRFWIEASCSGDPFARLREDLRLGLYPNSFPLVEEFRKLAISLCSPSPLTCARYTSEPLSSQGSDWQCQQLADLLLEFLETRARLLECLSEHCHRSHPSFQQWSKKYEEILFSAL